jgi:Leucine-rich repeat (LRR) protein
MNTKLKIVFFIFVMIFFSRCKKDELVRISDHNFMSALIKMGLDSDKDGNISKAEADTVTRLNLSYMQISDMTGIQLFRNLKDLNCTNNLISRLDLSGN